MLKRTLTELSASIAIAVVALLAVAGMETLPSYLMDYLLRAGLVYQGY
ncbi:hypothetical protein U91I_01573 [alpha proteobacterium U9-1i]|nr:hypothetical protein U91I_01573 [alpha proteobacterium U9-1i]